MNCIPLPDNPFDEVDSGSPSFGQSDRKLDALFIPTIRASSPLWDRLEELAAIAETVWILPSGAAGRSFRTAASLPSNVRCLSDVQVTELQASFLGLPSAQNPCQSVLTSYDLPIKRNIALAIAQATGCERICLLDDDIEISGAQLCAAASALGNPWPVVGFYVLDFPDVSTIDHVHRLTTGLSSRTMPGGNCLLMKTSQVSGIFPYIYNEDWIFVMHNLRARRGAAVGNAKQMSHEPWDDEGRVRFEEFGELIVCGLLAVGQDLEASVLESLQFWQHVKHERVRWLKDLRSASQLNPFQRPVDVATEFLLSIDPKACVTFIVTLRNDMVKGIGWIHEAMTHQ